MDAWARRSLAPLLRSAGRKFNPGVPEILSEAGTVARELGYPERVIGGVKVGWIVREPGPPAHFSLYDEDANLLGRCKHALLGVGHGPLGFPGVYGKARENPEIERPRRAGLRAEGVPRGRPLSSSWAPASPSVNEWVELRRRRRPVHRRSGATRIRTSRT